MENKTYSRLLVSGSIAYDDILDFPGEFKDYFQKDKLHQINVSFVVNRLEKQLGGTATNISYNLSLLTRKPVSILGAVGKDGEAFLRFCREHQIDTRNVIKDKRLYTASGKVITDKKDNQIWGFYYGASARGKDISLQAYRRERALLVISATHKKAFLNIQGQAVRMGIPYLYDPGMALTWVSPAELRRGTLNARWVVGNDYEIARVLKLLRLTPETLSQKGVGVITTLGEKGVSYKDAHEHHFVPGYKVKNPLDPTGAGDAWRGGFLAGIAEGKSILECLTQGNAIASFAVERYGTLNHKPSRQEVAQRVKTIARL